MNAWRIARHVAGKDLRIEWHSRVLTNQVLPFAGVTMVIFAFALDARLGLLEQAERHDLGLLQRAAVILVGLEDLLLALDLVLGGGGNVQVGLLDLVEAVRDVAARRLHPDVADALEGIDLAVGDLIPPWFVAASSVAFVATAVILAPVAASAALAAPGLDMTQAFLAVAFGTSCAYMLPFAHQCNLMVMGPGGYSTKDFAKIGAGLSIVMAVVSVGLLAVL